MFCRIMNDLRTVLLSVAIVEKVGTDLSVWVAY